MWNHVESLTLGKHQSSETAFKRRLLCRLGLSVSIIVRSFEPLCMTILRVVASGALAPLSACTPASLLLQECTGSCQVGTHQPELEEQSTGTQGTFPT
jgi:hypothetical protein